MSQRVAKVESIIQAVAARSIMETLEHDAAQVTVTRVDAAADLRNATVWIGLLGDDAANHERLWKRIQYTTYDIQTRLGKTMTTKFVPQVHFKRDTGGAYAEKIEHLLRNI